jgi:hypothetical protein
MKSPSTAKSGGIGGTENTKSGLAEAMMKAFQQIPDEIAALMTLVYPDWRDLDDNEPLDKEVFRDVRATAIRIHEAGYSAPTKNRKCK